MRRMSSIGLRRAIRCGACTALTIATLAGVAAPVAAVQVGFNGSGIGFASSDGLLALPNATIDLSTEILMAGDLATAMALDVDLDLALGGTAAGCVLTTGNNVCQPDLTNFLGDYSALITLDVSVLNTQALSGQFTLVLLGMGLSVTDEAGMSFGYDASEVAIELSPANVDPAVVSGLVFDGSFTPFVRIRDVSCAFNGGICDYIGWTVEDGDSVSFRYESVSTQGRPPPVFFYAAIPIVVPEPGTALLMGLGLAGLTFSGRRIGR